ncbi:arginase family protein [Paenibacillus terrae]|uniref:arginase family protein n=1 Tax=Paenibacillus terrae TaxID=159743 RepID=UPI0005CBFF16|nr:arginase family protein [Paenibacillus terrae]
MEKEISIIHAPTNLGLSRHPDGRERGCWKLPAVLEELGLHTAIGAQVATRLSQPAYPKKYTYNDGALFGAQVAAFSIELADTVEEVLSTSAFSLVLGGDCSVLLGSALALARKGNYGLVHMDAHPDYYHKGNRDKAVVAGMDLAIVTGKGTDILTNLENRKPYIQSSNALTFGYRESDPEQSIIEEAKTEGITCFSAERSLREGGAWTADFLNDFIHQREVDGFWLHLDADVLDKTLMPCVDCPESHGLQWKELTDVLRVLLKSPQIVGMSVAILDPELDPGLKVAANFKEMLTAVLRP